MPNQCTKWYEIMNNCTLIKTTSLQRYFRTFMVYINDHTTSRKCLFFLSATLLWGVLSRHIVWWNIPWFDKYTPNFVFIYSFPLSIRSIITYLLYWVINELWKSWEKARASFLIFIKYNHIIWEWQSIKVINHL